ncbi:MAG: hypothetical protein PWP40_2602 [Rhodocyclaceae bacterium]|nr:hypothetical protein [Rhodocyclaceae bacterium]
MRGRARCRAERAGPCRLSLGAGARSGYHCGFHSARGDMRPCAGGLPLTTLITPPIVSSLPTERPRVPTITVGLRPHPTSPDAGEPGAGPVGRLLATMFALPEGGAVFEFRLEDSRLGRIAIPDTQPPGPADGLWEHTCFEVFLGVPGEPQYREYNFSPSGQWAVYAFRAWRERDQDFAPAAAPEITCTQEDGTLVLEAWVPPELLPTVPAGSDLQVNLAAVIERKDGQFEYWTLRHVAAQPDFHARDTFVLILATATHKKG